jgi:hypothetical protein
MEVGNKLLCNIVDFENATLFKALILRLFFVSANIELVPIFFKIIWVFKDCLRVFI